MRLDFWISSGRVQCRSVRSVLPKSLHATSSRAHPAPARRSDALRSLGDPPSLIVRRQAGAGCREDRGSGLVLRWLPSLFVGCALASILDRAVRSLTVAPYAGHAPSWFDFTGNGSACALFRAVRPLAYVQCAAAGRHGTLYRTSAQSGEQHAKKWYVRQVPRPCNGTTILQERSRSAMDRPFRFSDNKTSRVPLPEQSAFFSWRVDRQTAFLR